MFQLRLLILEKKIRSWNHSWVFLHIATNRIDEFSENLT